LYLQPGGDKNQRERYRKRSVQNRFQLLKTSMLTIFINAVKLCPICKIIAYRAERWGVEVKWLWNKK